MKNFRKFMLHRPPHIAAVDISTAFLIASNQNPKTLIQNPIESLYKPLTVSLPPYPHGSWPLSISISAASISISAASISFPNYILFMVCFEFLFAGGEYSRWLDSIWNWLEKSSRTPFSCIQFSFFWINFGLRNMMIGFCRPSLNLHLKLDATWWLTFFFWFL